MATLTLKYTDVSDDYMDYVEAANAVYEMATGNEPRYNGFGHDAMQPNYRAFVAEQNEEVTGFCYGLDLVKQTTHWFPRYASMFVDGNLLKNTTMLAELHVSPEHQRKGIGTTLLSMWLDNLTLPAVLSAIDGDTPAVKLYLRNGFKFVARDLVFPGESNKFVIMKRD